jgi:hypothetical protein
MNIALLYVYPYCARQDPHPLKSICLNRGSRLGHFIVPKTHSLGVNFALHEFSCPLQRCPPAMQNQFGSQVCARESNASCDDRE